MQLKYLLWLFLIPLAQAEKIRVMNYNIMCQFCTKEGYDDFDERIMATKKLIHRYSADLISLQELISKDQVESLLPSQDYRALFYHNWAFSYPDSSLIINIKRFKILKHGHFWLTPQQGFGLGWKWALPRISQWALLEDLIDHQKFYFIGAHLDNLKENKEGASAKIIQFVEEKKLPVVFAADTNSPQKSKSYQLFTQTFTDSFTKKGLFEIYGEQESALDLCYLHHGKEFPNCRVDHVFFWPSFKWKVSEWIIDITRHGKNMRFPSDHRPVLVGIELLK